MLSDGGAHISGIYFKYFDGVLTKTSFFFLFNAVDPLRIPMLLVYCKLKVWSIKIFFLNSYNSCMMYKLFNSNINSYSYFLYHLDK